MAIVLATGGFDPLHDSHIDYLRAAADMGDRLIVGLNTDEWLTHKKGRPFMTWNQRKKILINLSFVDSVVEADWFARDGDTTARRAILHALSINQRRPGERLVFANGGDRERYNTPEEEQFKEDDRVIFAYNVGGIKKNSSSELLNNWKERYAPGDNNEIVGMKRDWGHYKVLHEEKHCRVKELVIEPGRSISLQQHLSRGEHWFVIEGSIDLERRTNPDKPLSKTILTPYEFATIHKYVWHKATNRGNSIARVIEIQYGEDCRESDIIRYKENV